LRRGIAVLPESGLRVIRRIAQESPMHESLNDGRFILARALAAAGGAAWTGARTLHASGVVQAGGLSGPCSQWVDLPGARFALHFTLGPAAMAGGHDGVVAWQRSANGEVVVQDSDAGLRAAATDAWINARGWWFAQRLPATVASLGRREADGAVFDVLRCVPAGGSWVELWFEASSHLPARIVQEVLGRPSMRRLEDYRDVGGLRLPFRVASGNGDPRFDRVTQFETITLDATPPAAVFDVPRQAFDDVVFTDGGAAARIPIDIVNHHVFVDVTVDGHPLRFMVDTGGVNLVARAAAQRIGLASLGAIEARGPGDEPVGSGFARVDRLEIGGAVALERQLLRVLDMPGFDDVEGVAVDGVLGVELFKRLAVQIDYAARVLTLAEPAGFVPPAGARALPITFFGHFPGVAGDIDGIAGQFWLDTGNRGGLVLLAPFVEANGLDAAYAASAPTTIGWGIGGRVEGRLARGGSLRMGDLGIEGPVLRLPAGNGGALAIRHVAGNIGGEILGRFVVTFDYASRIVHLAPADDGARPFGADRGGLWINRHPQGAVVAAVMAGGPADAAGLRPLDVLTAVDGTPVDRIGLPELRQQLRDSDAGRRLALTVQRGAQGLQVELVLRDLIPARSQRAV
jgi:hypothetical protein